MHKQIKPTEQQIELIKKLDSFKNNIWNSKTTEEIIGIANKAIEISKNIQPAIYISGNGVEKIDNKGKLLVTEVLKSDIQKLENTYYSTFEDEKFAIVSSIQLLIGIFVNLSSEELIKLLNE